MLLYCAVWNPGSFVLLLSYSWVVSSLTQWSKHVTSGINSIIQEKGRGKAKDKRYMAAESIYEASFLAGPSNTVYLNLVDLNCSTVSFLPAKEYE